MSVTKRIPYKKIQSDVVFIPLTLMTKEIEDRYKSHDFKAVENLQVAFAAAYLFANRSEREFISDMAIRNSRQHGRHLGVQLISAPILADARNHKSGRARPILDDIASYPTPYSTGFFPGDRIIAPGVGSTGLMISRPGEFFGLVGSEEFYSAAEAEDIDGYNETPDGQMYDLLPGRGWRLSAPGGTGTLFNRLSIQMESLGLEAKPGTERTASIAHGLYTANFVALSVAVGIGITGPVGIAASVAVTVVGYGIDVAFITPALEEMKYGHLVEPTPASNSRGPQGGSGAGQGNGAPGAVPAPSPSDGSNGSAGQSESPADDKEEAQERRNGKNEPETPGLRPDDGTGKVAPSDIGGGGIEDPHARSAYPNVQWLTDIREGDIVYAGRIETVVRNDQSFEAELQSNGFAALLREDASKRLFSDIALYEREAKAAIADVVSPPAVNDLVDRSRVLENLQEISKRPL